MYKGKLIVFSGLDCSGKSTQIELLSKNLKMLNHKPYVFWSRGGYTPGFELLKKICRKLMGSKLPKSGVSIQRQKALDNIIIRKIWLTVAMLDLIIFYSIYLRLKSLLGFYIICDRYVIDTNIDFKIAYPKEHTENWLLWKLLITTALKPTFHFVSTIPVKESVKRSKFKFEPFPDEPHILEKRLKIYLNEIKCNKNVLGLNGLENVLKINNEILKKLKFNMDFHESF